MTHGGKRKGSGRKLKYGEPTVAMRIPLSLVESIKVMLSALVKIENKGDRR